MIATYETYHFKKKNKMELLQSQAPIDRELSGFSASARHGTWDMGHRNLEILNRRYFRGRVEGTKKAEEQE